MEVNDRGLNDSNIAINFFHFAETFNVQRTILLLASLLCLCDDFHGTCQSWESMDMLQHGTKCHCIVRN